MMQKVPAQLPNPFDPKPSPFQIPDPPPKPPPGLESFGDFVVGVLKWGGILAVIAGLVICAIMMAIGRRNRSEMAAQGAVGLPWVIAAALIIAGAASITSGLLNAG